MITTLRQSLKSHAYRIFLWGFLAIMIFGGLSFDFADTSKWSIKVYKEKVTDIEWHQSLMNAQRQLDYIKSLGIDWPRTEPLEQEVLRHSVSNLLLQHNAKELDLVIPSVLIQDKLEETLHHLPAHFFDASGKLNVQMLERQIAPRTFDGFVAEIENEIRSNFIHSIVDLGSSYVQNFEVVSQYNEEHANKKYTILNFSLHKAIEKAQKTAVSDEVLERFYKKNEHGDTYKTAEKRAGTYWKFSAHNYGIQVSAQDVSTYYEEHKQADYLESAVSMQVRRIVCDSRDHAQAIHEEVKLNPTSFEAVAKKIATAKQKGQSSDVTEFFTKESTKHDKVMVETAFEQLHQDNDISDIIKTDKGYEILQRVARKSAQYKSLSSVKEQITAKLLEEKFTKRFQQDAERLTGHADYNDNQAIHSFIEKHHGHKEVIALEAKKPGLENMHLFKTDLGHYAVFMDGKDGILLQCTEITKKALKPFNEIKATVAADYYKKQAQQDLESIAAQAMKQAAHMNFQEIAKEHDAELTHGTFSYKDGKSEFSQGLQRPDVSQKIKSLQTVGEMVDLVTPTESLLIRLDEIAPIDQALFVEKELTIKNALSSKAKYRGRDSFIASLCRRATINDKILIRQQLLKDEKETV